MKIDEEASGFTSAWGNREALVSALVEVGRGYYGRLRVLPLLIYTVHNNVHAVVLVVLVKAHAPLY